MPKMEFRVNPEGRLTVSVIWSADRITQWHNKTVADVIKYAAARGGVDVKFD